MGNCLSNGVIICSERVIICVLKAIRICLVVEIVIRVKFLARWLFFVLNEVVVGVNFFTG